MRKQKCLGLLAMVCLMVSGTPLVSFGATKTVSSVTIRVGCDTEAG